MTIQAIATGSTDLPRRGYLLRDFCLRSTEGKEIRISDYRGRGNLVVIAAGLCHDGVALPLIQDLASRHAEVLEEEAWVLLILHCSVHRAALLRQQHQLPFVVLADEEGRVHRQLGAMGEDGRLGPAVYVADRFAEVFAAFRLACGEQLPDGGQIVGWLDFVNRQCPECFPPEWPAL
ncbi:MAG: peroxiredoxin family protein [Terriglobales bacterium]